MTTTEQDFLRILRAAVLGEPLPEGFSVSEAGALFALARRQDLGHLLSSVLGASVGEEATAHLERERLRAVWRAGVLSHEEKRITAILDREGIPYLPLKGAVVRALWPEPWMRTSCDLDILVPEADSCRAAELLVQELAYTVKGQTYHNHSLYSKGDAVHLELHFSLAEGGAADAVLSRVWEHATVSAGACHRLSTEFLLLHLIAHLATHFAGGGGGVRPIVDIYLVRHALTYDEGRLTALLTEAGLARFGEAVFRLAEVWLGNAPADGETDRLGTWLLEGALYSDIDRRASVERAKRKTRASRREARRAGASYLCARLFLSRERLAVLYPILERRPWLTSFCQVRRWFGLLFGGRLGLALRRARAAARVSSEERDEAAELLTSLGLVGRQNPDN